MSAASLPPVNAAEFSVEEILEATGGQLRSGHRSLQLGRVVTDTRLLNRIAPQTPLDASERAFDRSGAQFSRAPEPILAPLFIALRGENFDGHRFVDKAFELGAGAAIVDNLAPKSWDADKTIIVVQSTLQALGDLARAHRRRFDLPIIGVTGSYGKTTTRALIEAALRSKYFDGVLATTGNFNNEIGLPLTLLSLDSHRHQAAVLELAMRGAGQIDYLARITQPTIGVITNIGPQHIELLGSLEAIADAKGELLDSILPDGVAVLPADDVFFERLKARAKCRVVSFGQSERADYQVRNFLLSAEGSEFEMATPGEKVLCRLPLLGIHNAIDAAAALAVACELGMDLEDAARALESVDVPGARMRVLRFDGRDLTIIDDSYNAGPNSMRAALETLRAFPNAHRRVAILGSMKELGDWSESEHHKIGEQVPLCADVLLAVGEEAKVLCDAAEGIEKEWCVDAEAAEKLATEMVREGDVVLVKGSRSVGLEKVVSALES